MQNHVTVIPQDKTILFDGQGLRFDFAAPANLHALQWHNGAGHIEYNDDSPNRLLGVEDYAAEVAPFAALWQAENDRLVEEASRPPTPEEQLAAFAAAIQAHLDNFARTRNYDGILSAATYATSTVPKFRAEGQYAVEARDAAWAKGYEIMGAVMAGQRAMPTLEEVIDELPALAWPGEG